MRARLGLALASLVFCCGVASAADRSTPSSIHAQGGPAFFVTSPSGREPWDLGYAASAGLDAGIAYGASATFDLGYSHFGPGNARFLGRVGDNLIVGGAAPTSEAKLLTVLVGAKYLYRGRVPKLIVPYAKVAGGLGHLSYAAADSNAAAHARSVSRVAVAGAAGMEIHPRWLPLGLMVEAQYVHLFTEELRVRFVPLRAGLTLGF